MTGPPKGGHYDLCVARGPACASALALTLIAAPLAACRPAPPPPVNEVVALVAPSLPIDPADAAWQRAPEYLAKLVPQDQVEPRLLTPSTPEVRVKALTSGGEIALRLEWADAAVNDTPGPGAFLDGCAIQIPRTLEAAPPDPQMGQAGRPVDIVFWRADWQASVDGRPDTLTALYPNAAINGYPFEARPLEPGSAAQREAATRYAPAQALGNRRVGPRPQPVEDMVAEGPGTIAAASAAPGGIRSRGKGARTATGWAVVIVRAVPAGLAPDARTAIAFAVWDGAAREAGARKMRTIWVPLAVRG
ncbi:MAG: hypothetical protein HY824_05995 [Acidobacteria bacterium]|nr:hypothetical protein [Acidobacteriota bacterium]